MQNDIKSTELETLATFKKHRPSEYFSHLEVEQAFESHDSKIERLYRFGLTFPPEFFNDKTLIDLGSGTGEHTVSLARWGAKCTLVEMNSDAVEVAKSVFQKYSKNLQDHCFINGSLYDIDIDSLRESFDISHSRGVFTHVADKSRAFNILAALAKPGGYVIYGDRNTCGGLQEMLQRLAIYHLGGVNDEKIVEIAEILFSEDIDRSQNSVPRTREAIIFDRWVIQQQDDPSVEDVLAMFESEGLEYVSSWPRIDFPARGVSTHSDPCNSMALRKGAQIIESLWMILNEGEEENISSFLVEGGQDYLSSLAKVSNGLRNLQIKTCPNVSLVKSDFLSLYELSKETWGAPVVLGKRLQTFFHEVNVFLELLVISEKPENIRKHIDDFEILFKGYAGVRHVDYVAYKRK